MGSYLQYFLIKLLGFQQETGPYPTYAPLVRLLFNCHSNLTMQKSLVVKNKYFCKICKIYSYSQYYDSLKFLPVNKAVSNLCALCTAPLY